MADLSKLKLNGTIYNFKDAEARLILETKADNTLATETADGLLSADDKKILNNLNPNIERTISNLNASEFNIINAK